MEDKDIKVLIGIPTKENIMAKTIACFYQAERYLNKKGIQTELIIATGTIVGHVRTKLLEQFHNMANFTHLVMLDSDQTFGSDFIYRLIKHDKDIIVAPSKIRSNLIYNVYTFEPSRGKYRGEGSIKGKGLIKVDAAGMGMIAITRKVGDCIKEISRQKDRGEDIAFCEQARKLNFEIWADCDLILGHLVMQELR